MGKQGSWGQQGQGGQWAYWPGAFASPKQAPWKHGQPQPKKDAANSKLQILAYDVKKPSSMQQGQEAAAGEQSLVKELQRALNGARKAEGKVKKILADRDEKVTLWENWQKEVRAKFLQEKKRHQHNLTTLDQELKEALAQQDAARALVRKVAAEEQADGAQAALPEAMEEDGFEQLIAEDEADPWEDFANEEVLQRALSEAASRMPSTPPPTRAAPRTPCPKKSPAVRPQITASVRALAPPGSSSASSEASSRVRPFPPPLAAPAAPHVVEPPPSPLFGIPVAADPYMFGDRQGQGGTEVALTKALVLSPNAPPKTPKARVPVKDSAKPSGPVHHNIGGVSRAELIEAKRAALTVEAAMSSGLAESPVGAPPATTCVLQDDDNSPQEEPPGDKEAEDIMD